MRKILFVSEGATLSHVARPLALASSLTSEFEVFFACPNRWHHLATNEKFHLEDVKGICPKLFASRLEAGKPLFDLPTLTRSVEEDLALLNEIEPDVVVGDLRLSLAVSSRLAGVPYINICNAYWSPWVDETFQVPEFITTRLFPLGVANALFHTFKPLTFAQHARPFNKLKKHFGIREKNKSLQEIYTEGDFTVYADVSQWMHYRKLPSNHSFIGPLRWSYPAPVPLVVRPTNHPVIFVSVGTSGNTQMVPTVLKALGSLGADLYVVSANRVEKPKNAGQVHWFPFAPAADLAREADLVVCNGGSTMLHTVLGEGVPILAIPSNLDQHLSVQSALRQGAVLSVRSDRVTENAIKTAAQELLTVPSFQRHAANAKLVIENSAPFERFRAVVKKALNEEIAQVA